VIGILLAKDLLRVARDVPFRLRDWLRPAVFIPNSSVSTSCCASFASRAITWRSSSTNTPALPA
jgi:Mg2+/Co2+ transporter CorC